MSARLDPSGGGDEDGFTIAEMLVAFTIVALGTVTAIEVATAVVRAGRRIETALVISDEAPGIVALRVAAGTLRPGWEAGRFSDGRPWSLSVTDVGPIFGWRNAPPTWSVRLTRDGPGGPVVYETILAAGIGD